jgi:hypothetical protein
MAVGPSIYSGVVLFIEMVLSGKALENCSERWWRVAFISGGGDGRSGCSATI